MVKFAYFRQFLVKLDILEPASWGTHPYLGTVTVPPFGLHSHDLVVPRHTRPAQSSCASSRQLLVRKRLRQVPAAGALPGRATTPPADPYVRPRPWGHVHVSASPAAAHIISLWDHFPGLFSTNPDFTMYPFISLFFLL